MLFVILACGLACHKDNPQVEFDQIYREFLHGDLIRAQNEAGQASQHCIRSNPDWSRKFKTLQAEAMLWRGQFDDALKLLKSEPTPVHQPQLAVHTLALIGTADAFLRRFPQADESIKEAERLCETSAYAGCGEVIGARALLADLRGDFSSAEKHYATSLAFAREHGDRFLESKTLRNLGHLSLAQERFDEAIDRSQASYDAAAQLDARVVALRAKANIGWADYRLGDRERALEAFRDAEKRASELGDIFDQANELTNTGYVYMDQRRFDLATQSFQQALSLAEGINAKEYIYNALRVLARLNLQTGDLEKASQYAARALQIAKEGRIHKDELYPRLVQGQIAARRGDGAGAKQIFEAVEQDKLCPVFLKWEAQHSLARLFEDQKQFDAADREYRVALQTFESARDTVRHEDFHLSFLTNAASIYDDYIHFLVSRGRSDDGLRWADFNRARTLAEGLGLLKKGASLEPPPLNAREISRNANGTLLFYWLGEKQSYLWAITPQSMNLFALPPGPEIETVSKRYRETLDGSRAVFVPEDADGRWLYHTLIEPAQSIPAARPSGAKALVLDSADGTANAVPFPKAPFPQDASSDNPPRIFIFPDGTLNNLNFETLIVPDPKPHFWIEDATITDASSLRVLAASLAGAKKGARRLLLMGNGVPPNNQYPALPKAAAQMDSVAGHFPADGRRVLAQEQATPAAYLESKPEQFSHIHFVAHGIASRLSPLDSAIVLSRGGGGHDDSFKLYARDILRHPLRAELVTVSACHGAEGRSYSGEGLVGLSWAFLRAGAHNVVAALWEVTDVSTEQLMGRFYDELDQGASPDVALRSAKLSLLRSQSVYRNPFYWAPFQLYAGS